MNTQSKDQRSNEGTSAAIEAFLGGRAIPGLKEALEMRDKGALFVVNHSGGKDSQAAQIVIQHLVPKEQILILHANLGEIEWPGVVDHIKATGVGRDLIVTSANKTFFDMVLSKGFWPTPKYRQCTSDLKRGPLKKSIRSYLKENPRYGGLVVNVMGLRGEESANRKNKTAWVWSKADSKAGRQWYDWLPIHLFSEKEVFGIIKTAGQEPHWPYERGMGRLSCQFCIMGCKGDLTTAAKLSPRIYALYSAMEMVVDQTFTMPSSRTSLGLRPFLPDVTGTAPDWAIVAEAFVGFHRKRGLSVPDHSEKAIAQLRMRKQATGDERQRDSIANAINIISEALNLAPSDQTPLDQMRSAVEKQLASLDASKTEQERDISRLEGHPLTAPSSIKGVQASLRRTLMRIKVAQSDAKEFSKAAATPAKETPEDKPEPDRAGHNNDLLKIMAQMQVIRGRIANAIEAGKAQSGIDAYQEGLKALQKRVGELKQQVANAK